MTQDLRKLIASSIGEDEHLDPKLAAAMQSVCQQLQWGNEVGDAYLVEHFPEHFHELVELLPTLKLLTQKISKENRAEVLPGTTLGEYRLLKEIGRGGMGVVYQAEQLSLRRYVAIKLLHASAMLDDRRMKRFQSEVRAAAMLRHPHIVSVHRVDFQQGIHFYVMDLIEGKSLAETIHDARRQSRKAIQPAGNASRPSHRTGPTRYHRVAKLGIQAAQALHYAHEQGVIHRDIKPSNLLLDLNDNLLITDFGLARIETEEENLTRTNEFLGTLRYMSPEQIEKRAVDRRTDVYSLGVTLYEFCCGYPAFEGTTAVDLSREVIETEPKRLWQYDRSLPRDLATIIHKAADKDPQTRYSSALEFAQDLERFLNNEPVIARPSSALRRSWRWCRRNQWKAALLGMLGVILLVLAVGGPLLAIRQSNNAAIQAKLADSRLHLLYNTDMGRAHRHIEQGEVETALQLLRKHLPGERRSDFRNFEWYEMLHRCRRRMEAETVPLGWPVWDVAYGPKGNLAATSYFGGLHVFDTRLQQKWMQPRGKEAHTQVIRDCCFVHQGRILLTTAHDQRVIVWNAETGEKLDSITLLDWPRSIAVSVRGLIAFGCGPESPSPSTDAINSSSVRLGRLTVKENSSGLSAQLRLTGELQGAYGEVYDLDFSPDGRMLAAASEDGSVRVWNHDARQLITTFSGHNGPVSSVSFSANGKRALSAGHHVQGDWTAGEAYLWDVVTGHQRQAYRHGQLLFDAVFDAEGRVITAGDDRRIKIWDAESGGLVEEINAHANLIRRLAVSPDGNLLASASEDNSVRVWNLTKTQHRLVAREPNVNELTNLAFSPDSRVIASVGYRGDIRLWDAKDSRLIKTLSEGDSANDGTWGVGFSPDNRFLAVYGNKQLTLWNIASGHLVKEAAEPASWITALAFHPNGKHLVLGNGGKIYLWNIADWKLESETKGSSDRGHQISISNDGDYIATARELWRYPTLERVIPRRSEKDIGMGVDFHPDNQTFATSDSHGHVLLRNIFDGSIEQKLVGHESRVIHLNYAPDGKRLVSSSQQGTVILWNLETGSEIIRFRDHRYWCMSAEFSPDGQILASCQMGRRTLPSIAFHRAISKGDAIELLATEKSSD